MTECQRSSTLSSVGEAASQQVEAVGDVLAVVGERVLAAMPVTEVDLAGSRGGALGH